MDTMTKTNQDIYEFDMRNVIKMIDALRAASDDACDDAFIMEATVKLYSMNDYPIGTLTLDDSQWVFTPHNESDVEV